MAGIVAVTITMATFLIFLSSSRPPCSPFAISGLPMISIDRAIARIVGGSFASPVPLSPTTRPSPRSTFSSCPLMRQMFFSCVRADAGPLATAITHAATTTAHQIAANVEWFFMVRIRSRSKLRR